MNDVSFKKTAILGVGLLGASLALAMKKSGITREVTGYGRSKGNLARALELGIIDSFESDPAEACKDADLVVFATPVGSFLDVARIAASSLRQGTVVTDVGSVKGSLVYEMETVLAGKGAYIGGHPIAGSERSGIDAACAGLFKDSKCIITPTENSDRDALKKVSDLWRAVGSEVIFMPPEEHDRIYASVSHLPHMIAYAIMNTVSDIDDSYLRYCGKGFRDITRIAASSHELWRDICLLNRDNLVDAITAFQRNLETYAQYLRESDSESLEREFRRAQALREGIG